MSKVSSILVGSESGTVWIKLEGRGTFENSKCVKEFVQSMISKGHGDFVLDLEKCELMDSTFMGTLASVAFSLRNLESGLLRVVRANNRNFSLLEGLGLDHLFQLEAELSNARPRFLKRRALPLWPRRIKEWRSLKPMRLSSMQTQRTLSVFKMSLSICGRKLPRVDRLGQINPS